MVSIVTYSSSQAVLTGYLSGEVDAMVNIKPFINLDPDRPMRTPPEPLIMDGGILNQWHKPAYATFITSRCAPSGPPRPGNPHRPRLPAAAQARLHHTIG
eukprot:7407331-Pyramimonas_sp.AAC.1